jgi:hypothetical protein
MHRDAIVSKATVTQIRNLTSDGPVAIPLYFNSIVLFRCQPYIHFAGVQLKLTILKLRTKTVSDIWSKNELSLNWKEQINERFYYISEG